MGIVTEVTEAEHSSLLHRVSGVHCILVAVALFAIHTAS
jgi:hypothetical protein